MPLGGTHLHPKPMVAVSRPVGQNDVGMIAWTLTLKTPECPQGRKVRSCGRWRNRYQNCAIPVGHHSPGLDAGF